MPRIIVAFSVVFLLLAAVIVLSRITYHNTLKQAALTERSRKVIKLYEDIDLALRSAEIFSPLPQNSAAKELFTLYTANTDSVLSDLKNLHLLMDASDKQAVVVDSLDGLIHRYLPGLQTRAGLSLLETEEVERFASLSNAHRLIRKGLQGEEELLYTGKQVLDNANRWNNAFTLILSGLATAIIIATFFSQYYLNRKKLQLEGFLESVLNTSQNGILHCRAVRRKRQVVDFRLAFANRSSGALLNADPSTATGKRWSEIETFKHSSLFDACVEVVDGHTNKELEYQSAENGRQRSFALSITRLNDGVTISFYENTVIKQTAQELTENIAALRTSNSELEEYAYAASHDLQEPLRKIRTFGSFLKETQGDRLDENGREQLDKILTSTERMTMLIRDLLSYSGLKIKEAEFEPTDLNVLLEAVLEDLEVVINQQHAVITHEKLPEIAVIPVQMNQLFYNLVNNSLKFARPGLPLHLDVSCRLVNERDVLDISGLKPGGYYYEIVFSDNGIGFSQQYARQIFELFKRLHDKQRYAGSGIGLSLCKKVVQNHDGVMEANGKEGIGAQFYIYLPANRASIPLDAIKIG